MRRILAMVFSLLLALPALAADKTYVNPRFGTTITFSDAIFSRTEPAPENGDGQRWSSPDGATLAVWGQFNILDQTPATLADFVSQSIPKVTYRKVGSNWMVVSGFDGEMIVYQRGEIGREGIIHSMELRYPASLAAHYDKLASRIADSLIGP